MEFDDEESFILNLIQSVHAKRCLYHKADAFYFNKTIKEKAWKTVAEICKREVTDCKHRWKLLRERFCKEMKKAEAPSGSGMCFVEEWKFLKPMMFLRDSLAPRRTRDNTNTIIIENQDTDKDNDAGEYDEIIFDESPSSQGTPSGPKKAKTTMQSLLKKFDEAIDSYSNSLLPGEEVTATDEAFMKAIVLLMKDLPVEVKDQFQANMFQELYHLRAIHSGGGIGSFLLSSLFPS